MARASNIPLVASSYERNFAGGVRLRMLNRFFEEDSFARSGYSSVARPGTAYVATIGAGPTLRAVFTQEGVFNDDLFVISGDGLYRYDGVTTQLITGAVGFSATFPSIAVQSSPGIERLWVADGDDLQYYEGLSKSQATLQVDSGTIAATETVEIDGVYYEWVASGVDTGSPAGTLANPWKVLLGIDNENSLLNLADAIDNSGTPGATYSTALTKHPTAESRRRKADHLIVQAQTAGSGGDSITVSDTSAALSWDDTNGDPVTTLVSGGLHFLTRIELPEDTDDMKALAVASVEGHIVVAANNSQRMYFIFPGEFWTDTFADAESEPDELIDVATVGDLLWVLGTSTIEVWAATGDATLPFAPIQGRGLKFGAIRDTVVVLDNRLFYVDTTGIVRDQTGQRLSTHTVEEKIRLRG